MNQEVFMQRIGLPEAAIRQVLAHSLSDQAYQRDRRLFLADEERFFTEREAREEGKAYLLAFFVRMALDAREVYVRRGVAEQIYYDTFSDLAIWCKACRRQYGVYGLAEGRWLARHVTCRIFRLGRLQFEPIIAAGLWCVPGSPLQPGQALLNVHIPEGEPLTIQQVTRSYQQAASFFDDQAYPFVCDSWLLDPALSTLIRPDANIARFAAQYQIIHVDPSERQAEERIFGTVLADAADYAQQSSLQRAARAYLVNGGRLGTAKGVRKAELSEPR